MAEELAEFPKKLKFLFDAHRYKVAYGGRGGAKSWGVARALLLQAVKKPLRILCARETQKSIADSVHKLLSDQIAALKLTSCYRVEKARILGTNGTEFIFAGLKHNINNIKSVESCDIVWVEEAQSVSKASWQVLIPTIRKEGSEIWLTFNPDLETDDTYKRFVLNPPPNAHVELLTFRDNRWFPSVLRTEMEHLKATDPKAYEHVWEGACKSAVEGAIYAEELKVAEAEGRITKVSCNRTLPVDTFWDLGFGDSTAVWFAQATLNGEYHLIDYLENHGKTLEWYLIQLQNKGYLYGTDWIPWDGLKPQRMGSGRAIEELMRAAGRTVRMVTMLAVHEGINAARTIFSQCRFDAEKCADGLQGLRHYQWGEPNANGEARRAPLHNWACVVLETEVLTRYGTHRIIDLPENGEILTPCGWKAYQGPKVTKRNAQLVEVLFKDGHSVRCTPEHLFLTASGWKSAESLTPGMLIQSSLTPSRSISMASCTGFTRTANIIRAAAAIFTGWCGKALSARSLRDATSTTRSRIWRAMESTICNACPQPNTCLPHGRQFMASAASTSQLPPETRPQRGTSPKLGGSGIVGTPRESGAGRSGSAKKRRVSSATSFLARWFERTAGSRSTVPKFAKPLSIAGVRPLPQRADVCCIHVDDGHWFSLANGAVIHNSHPADAFRYFATAIKTPELERERRIATRRNYGNQGWMA